MPTVTPDPTAAPPPKIEALPPDADALIREARERQRRRRMHALLAVVVAAAVGGTAYGLVRASGGSSTGVEHVPSGPVVNVRAFSHHGELAFISGATLWLLDGTHGKLRQLPTPGGGFTPVQPTFSPDGRWLAYLEQRQNPVTDEQYARLWIAHAGGSDPHVVPGLEVYGLYGWSPTADVLAVSTGPERTKQQSCPCYSPTTLRLISPDGSFRTVAHTGWLYGAAWSPSGNQIAVAAISFPVSKIVAYPVAGGAGTTWLSVRTKQRLNGMGDVLVEVTGWWPRLGIGFWVFGNGAIRNNDASPLDLIAAPGAKPRLLAQTLSDGTTDVVSANARGQLAVVADVSHGQGGGRVVWDKKQILVCGAAAACRPILGRPSKVTVDPVWAPNGRTLAFIEAPDYASAGWPWRLMRRWYADHRLLLYDPAGKTVRAVAAAKGATVPIWSPDRHSLLYVSGDALWLLPSLSARPVKIASPLFTQKPWPAYYGQIAWAAQFAWTSR